MPRKTENTNLKWGTMGDIKDMETKDIYQIIDDADISSVYRFVLIKGISLLLKQQGIKVRKEQNPLHGFTPYLFFDTEEQKKKYWEFIEELKKLK